MQTFGYFFPFSTFTALFLNIMPNREIHDKEIENGKIPQFKTFAVFYCQFKFSMLSALKVRSEGDGDTSTLI